MFDNLPYNLPYSFSYLLALCLEVVPLHIEYYTNKYHLPNYNSILSTSNRIPTRGQYQKRYSCIFSVASFLGNTIVSSNCTIVGYKCCSDVTIVQSDVTIVVPCQQSTGSVHDYLFCYCPLVGILFEVLSCS